MPLSFRDKPVPQERMSTKVFRDMRGDDIDILIFGKRCKHAVDKVSLSGLPCLKKTSREWVSLSKYRSSHGILST